MVGIAQLDEQVVHLEVEGETFEAVVGIVPHVVVVEQVVEETVHTDVGETVEMVGTVVGFG